MSSIGTRAVLPARDPAPTAACGSLRTDLYLYPPLAFEPTCIHTLTMVNEANNCEVLAPQTQECHCCHVGTCIPWGTSHVCEQASAHAHANVHIHTRLQLYTCTKKHPSPHQSLFYQHARTALRAAIKASAAAALRASRSCIATPRYAEMPTHKCTTK